jgi:hypothetical protein
MMDIWGKLTGLKVKGGGTINISLAIVKQFPWWRKKSIYFTDGKYYPIGNITIPKNVHLYFTKSSVLMPGQIFPIDNTVNRDWWGINEEVR